MASKFRVVKRIENAASDIRFLEECAKSGQIPNGFKWTPNRKSFIGDKKVKKEEKIIKVEKGRKFEIMITSCNVCLFQTTIPIEGLPIPEI